MSRAIDPLYVRYQVTNLVRLEGFLRDFGMERAGGSEQRLYMRGTGTAPYVYEAVRGSENRFLGAGLRVSCMQDLEALAKLKGSSPIEATTGAPGGGWRVRMRMPDGFEIDAVHFVENANGSAPADGLPFNTAASKPRVNTAVRVRREASPVRRLGHFVLHVTDHDASVAWLRERFGLLPSDFLAAPGQPDNIVGSFLRVDRGDEQVDHHCMLVLRTDSPGVHHCSFEVENLDAVMAAHDYLLARGYTLDCGVGRHLLGSQIFDYWRDPFGFRIEHYTDGDIVDRSHQPSVFAGTADETTQWGAKPPKDFFE
ncbi:VOC family protein [Variovorax terrae]|uniref:VOC family protein n=1 Tax=Variovorax terrae TaxID=2923278 RepID=A0A9X1W070_9BURK|nr:VOC family protein [Variovorax terrae]MCJ0766134.1 VOC family protein [Variovorax terrae]